MDRELSGLGAARTWSYDIVVVTEEGAHTKEPRESVHDDHRVLLGGLMSQLPLKEQRRVN
jgi:hypothetical protein